MERIIILATIVFLSIILLLVSAILKLSQRNMYRLNFICSVLIITLLTQLQKEVFHFDTFWSLLVSILVVGVTKILADKIGILTKQKYKE